MTDLESIAARLVWWMPPQEALADPQRFLAQVMVYGTAEDANANREAAERGVFAAPFNHALGSVDVADTRAGGGGGDRRRARVAKKVEHRSSFGEFSNFVKDNTEV